MLAPASPAQVAQLVQAGGTGTAADVSALLPHAGRLPASVAGFLLDKDCRVIACRGAVPDHAASLSGKRPRG